MKRKIFSILGLALLLGSSNIISAQASEHIGLNASSRATFSITAEGTIAPTGTVDPEYPDDLIIPDDRSTITGNAGRLRIDYVSNFKFKTISIEDEDQFSHAELVSAKKEDSSYTTPNFIQVSDWRGTQAGWSVEVKQEGNFKSVDSRFEDEELEGTVITFKNITPNAKIDNEPVSSAASEIALDADSGSVFLFGAKSGEGVGTHVAYFGDYNKNGNKSAESSVELSIPRTAKKLATTYKTTLTWTLSSTPANEDDSEEGGINIDIGVGGWNNITEPTDM